MALGVATGNQSGSITATGIEIVSVAYPIVKYVIGSTINLTAAAAAGYKFLYWLTTWQPEQQITTPTLSYTATSAAPQSATAFFGTTAT
jgi:hypothetical protein